MMIRHMPCMKNMYRDGLVAVRLEYAEGEKKVFGGLYMPYYYSEEVKWLLVEQSDEKVELLYDSNPNTFELPLIGPRPPYYYNPRYVPYYPVI
ncbi:hypothetical protein ASG97_04220 [Bacillus sp. Soil745]|jgi:hypothetical protein|nr:hypothetical protein [Peribacillus frigoritolerans]KRF54615.1 hypothetical protein ASG97_04220 [Bacillus sp. Soil745]MDF1996157.1 hypothetical protein [Peribacillus frigoritolerans]MDG4848786.1 hypothetical protein [Peribacillus frigoritolerans]MED3786167.1 hypothetical protein [Peribacillus frigoritolerans]WHX69779.1 hypothetical protein QNH26_19405 [Peribacillus frigoritolerans]